MRQILLGKMTTVMWNQNNNKNIEWHSRCNSICLGPLTFDCQAVGDRIHLRNGARRAERVGNTFRDGLVFIGRCVKIRERIHFRVLKHELKWQGALRVGFTNMPPSNRPLPLPTVALPDLTLAPGHWAAAVPESLCKAGTELEFWVSAGGNIYCSSDGKERYKLQSGVNVKEPLWALLDVYGQTRSIELLGSKIKYMLHCRTSCPAPEPLSNLNHNLNLRRSCHDCGSWPGSRESEEDLCSVCLSQNASVTLPCGHTCLCDRCRPAYMQMFSTCPLCRREICGPQSPLR